MKELLSPYTDRGTWKNSEPVPLGWAVGWGGSKNTSWGGGRREKRHETCQYRGIYGKYEEISGKYEIYEEIYGKSMGMKEIL